MPLYLFTKAAENDLVGIFQYGFINYGGRKAEIYHQELKAKCQFLAENPEISKNCTEFSPPVRIHPHKKYLIIYTIKEDHILIIRVLHQQMDVPNQIKN